MVSIGSWILCLTIFAFTVLVLLYRRTSILQRSPLLSRIVQEVKKLAYVLDTLHDAMHQGYERVEALCLSVYASVTQFVNTPAKKPAVLASLTEEERTYLEQHAGNHPISTEHVVSNMLAPVRLRQHTQTMTKIFEMHTLPTSRRFWQLLKQQRAIVQGKSVER